MAVVTIWPMVCILGVIIWMSLQTFRPQRLRLGLHMAIRADLLTFARLPWALTPRERDKVQEVLEEITISTGRYDLEAVERDETRAYEVTASLFERSGQQLPVAEMEARADEIARKALERLETRLASAAPVSVARRWLLWSTIEEIRALLEACRRVGVPTARLVVSRAEGPVSRWGVIGLFTSLALWAVLSRGKPDVIAFGSAGMFIGACGGAGWTVFDLAHEAMDPGWRDAPRATKAVAAAGMILVLVMLVLLYEGVIPFGVPD